MVSAYPPSCAVLQVALGGIKYSEDGSLLAYQLSSGGSDWRTMHVLRIDAESGKPTKLDDELRHVKFSDIAWTHDNKVSSSVRLCMPALPSCLLHS